MKKINWLALAGALFDVAGAAILTYYVLKSKKEN